MFIVLKFIKIEFQFKEIDFDILKQQRPDDHQGLVNGLVYITKNTGVPQVGKIFLSKT